MRSKLQFKEWVYKKRKNSLDERGISLMAQSYLKSAKTTCCIKGITVTEFEMTNIVCTERAIRIRERWKEHGKIDMMTMLEQSNRY